MDLPRQGTWTPGANLAPIETHHWHNLGASTGHETLIGRIQVIAREEPLRMPYHM